MFSSASSQRLKSTDLAGIQYIGLNGITASCLEAITRLLNSRADFDKALLLTCNQEHAFLLFGANEDAVVVKSGFASGYSGEGPRGLGVALVLLHRHRIDIEECDVPPELMHRIEYSAVLSSDIELLRNVIPKRPHRWYDYIYDVGLSLNDNVGKFDRYYPLTLPFAIVDRRIIDLAIRFHDDEDASINRAYRRLEDKLRSRTGLSGEGTRLFSKIFLVDDAPLSWDVQDEAENKGRGNLFNAIYMAFRNARAHREFESCKDNTLREFLLVNELFRLESEAFTREELRIHRLKNAIEETAMRNLTRASNE